MIQNYPQRDIETLLKNYPRKFDYSLSRTYRILEQLGNPHLKLAPVIHITGTNGKGSSAAICRALLESAGYRVHVYSSPHLVNWAERYRIGQTKGGQLVTESQLNGVIHEISALNCDESLTIFEILTVAAFVLFSKHPADAVILEVGLGGRLDATNVIHKPAVSLIMPIDYDHETSLGQTIEQISFEKSGIIKLGVPVVVGKQDHDAAASVLRATAHKNKAPLYFYGKDYRSYAKNDRMIFQNDQGLMDLPLPNLVGMHQIENVGASLEAIYRAGFRVTKQDIHQALQNIDWPARMQHLTHGRLVDKLPPRTDLWLDGGHNPAAGKAIATELARWKRKSNRPIIMISGMLNTKDSLGYFQPFINLVDKIYTVPLSSSDAGTCPTVLAESAKKAGLIAEAQTNLQDALNTISLKHRDAIIFIGGSLYLAGNILRDNKTPPC